MAHDHSLPDAPVWRGTPDAAGQAGSIRPVGDDPERDIETAIATDELSAALTMATSRLRLIAVDRSVPRPVVGVAGDIFTRINPVGNQDLFAWLEDRGCEVWPAPFLVDIADFSLRRDWAKGSMGEAAMAGRRACSPVCGRAVEVACGSWPWLDTLEHADAIR